MVKEECSPRFISPADFNVSGQINTGWKTIHDTSNGTSRVGFNAGSPSNRYNVDVNLDFNYALGRAWISARTAFRNSGGLFGGSSNSFALSRGYIGYHFTVAGPVILDAYVGRRSLTKVYNSQLLFRGEGDGATLHFSYMPKEIVDIRASTGVYNDNARPYWIMHTGLFNIAKLGLYADYVFVHWGDSRPNTATNGIKLNYNISQFLVGWEYKPELLQKDIKVFAAMLLNHSAKINALSDGSREKTAGYVGFQVGNVKKQNDFSFQAQLQFCRLQAVPPWTMNGIGTGSPPSGSSLFNATNSSSVNDRTNFKGWEATVNYGISDNLTLTGKLQRSVPMNKFIGQDFNFTDFKLETQYTF